MKRIAIIALEENTVMPLKNDLIKLFKDIIEIDWYYISNSNITGIINADLALVTSSAYFMTAKANIKKGVEILIMHRTITKSGYEKLNKIPKGSKVALYNLFLEQSLETIAQINGAGIKNLNFIPAYKGMDNFPQTKIAVSPGESRLVPDIYEEVIDISSRKLDVSTIMDIISKLDIDYRLIEKRLKDYINEIIPLSYGVTDMLSEKTELNNLIGLIINIYDKAVIAFDKKGIVIKYNKKAENIFNFSIDNSNKLANQYIFSKIDTNYKKENIIINYEGRELIATNYPVIHKNNSMGSLLIIEEFYELEDSHQKIRKMMMNNGCKAKYRFSNILGKSEILLKTKKIAKKISDSNSTIVVHGESGTGKEVFAQAIHNNSSRKNGPFVAVNCSALPSNLLESELFGYEEGAFTGAKKGGSKGLFEAAHLGTIFLDEVSEIHLESQAKLLRVIQEKEIRKVGSNKVISIDTRIIAATNKDLKKMVKEGIFRKDLYYRLAVFILKLPSLEERKEDIPILINHFIEKRNRGKKIEITTNALKTLKDHDWPGNIRELENTVEYMLQMSHGKIDRNSLPEYIKEPDSKLSDTKIIDENININEDIENIMLILAKAYNEKKNMGRRSLYRELIDKNIFISEAEIRSYLLYLENFDLIRMKNGRAGTRLTKKGYNFFTNGLNGV